LVLGFVSLAVAVNPRLAAHNPDILLEWFPSQEMIMDNDAVIDQRTLNTLRDSVLAPRIPEYCSHLRLGRYAENTRRVYLRCVAHFACWLTTEQLGLDGIDEEAGRRFIADHLPRCDCPRPVRRTPHEIKAALTHLYGILGTRGAPAACTGPADIIGSELADFDRYMDQTCGLAASTRQKRIKIVARFLGARFGSGPIDLTETTAADLRQFVLGREERRSAGSISAMGGALRCYLRFRDLAGDPVGGLIAAIPSAAHWRLATLPDVLSQTEVEQLLKSFDGPLPSAKRAYAMVRCLTDLGLRASEVIHLQLDDIDWRAGTLRLAKGKSRRVDILPLPPETGRAIAEYLRTERPLTANRAVFVRHVAPYDEPIAAGVVRRAVREAYRRCGWTRSRVHTLRHSVASRLLQQGTPLKEIADILRHRSLDTSAIYAKVDTNRLAAVALPWPGRAS
jgi:integrase